VLLKYIILSFKKVRYGIVLILPWPYWCGPYQKNLLIFFIIISIKLNLELSITRRHYTNTHIFLSLIKVRTRATPLYHRSRLITYLINFSLLVPLYNHYLRNATMPMPMILPITLPNYLITLTNYSTINNIKIYSTPKIQTLRVYNIRL
jgi:hypothetical protein